MTKSTISFGIAILALCSASLFANPPAGWFMAGSKPAEYDASPDPQATYAGQPSILIKSIKPTSGGFGTMMQCFRGEQYLGKRIRYSANVKSTGIDAPDDMAGLWFRSDKEKQSVAFDNMMDRPIKGTTTWRNYEVVLDVPADSTGSCFGILLHGSGSVWINNIKLEVVSNNVPVTGRTTATLPDGPKNLGFDK